MVAPRSYNLLSSLPSLVGLKFLLITSDATVCMLVRKSLTK